jgi:hypothetical protein
MPAEQSMQSADPETEEYLPLAQITHVLAPVDEL